MKPSPMDNPFDNGAWDDFPAPKETLFERLFSRPLPPPDRSTLRRPEVDPNWEPGEGKDRSAENGSGEHP